jgi:hypothetical protein
VGYHGDVGFFKCELLNALTDNEEEEDDDEQVDDKETDNHEEDGFDDGGATWDPEHQLPDLNEDEAIQLTRDQSELDELAQWDVVAFQICESALA